MTKKDYELIAHSIYDELTKVHARNRESSKASNYNPLVVKIEERMVEKLAGRLAVELKSDNPKFKRDRFLEACGVTSDD